MDPTVQLWIMNIGPVVAAFGAAFGLYLKLSSQVKSSELRLRDEMQSVRTEMQSVRTEMQSVRTDMQSLRSEMKGDMESLRSEMKGDVKELKGDIKELKGEVKELGSRIQAVEVSVEGLKQNWDTIRSLLVPTMQESVRTALLQD